MSDTKIDENFTLKIEFSGNDGEVEIRRFVFASSAPFSEIFSTITERFGVSSDIFKLRYKDEDGDLVEISSDEELQSVTRSNGTATSRMFLVPHKKSSASHDSVINEKSIGDTESIGKEPSSLISGEGCDPSEQVTKDFELALKLEHIESHGNIDHGNGGCDDDKASHVTDKKVQEEEDLKLARLLQEEENRLPEKSTAVIGAAVLGAGIGLLAGGTLMAVAGAGIGALSASEKGRKKAGEVVVSTGRAATEAGRRITEATEQHRERARVAAAVLAVQAAEVKARTETITRDAIHRAQAGGLSPAPIGATVGRIVSVAGTALDRVRSRYSHGFRGDSGGDSNASVDCSNSSSMDVETSGGKGNVSGV